MSISAQTLSKSILLASSSLLLTSCSFVGGLFGVRSMYDAPRYMVVEKVTDDVEIRSYEKRLVAEVTVTNQSGRDGENAAFRILFDYITGKNTSAEEVAMTVPVRTSEDSKNDSEKIAMTVPVETDTSDASQTSMRFYFPDEYTLENAPVPTDDRIKVYEVDEENIAVYDISGWKGEESREKAKRLLIEELAATNWKTQGKPSLLYYDPPFTIPYFRRTEAIVNVTNE